MPTTLAIRIREMDPTAVTPLVGRIGERDQLRRLLEQLNHHALIVGPPGSGKTHLAQATLHQLATDRRRYELDLSSIVPALVGGEPLVPLIHALKEAARQLAPAVVLIDDLQQLGIDDPLRAEIAEQLLGAFTRQPWVSVLATLTDHSVAAFLRSDSLGRSFTTVRLAELTDDQAIEMLTAASPSTITIDGAKEAVRLARRYGAGRALPDSALRLVRTASQHATPVTATIVQQIVAEQTGIPLAAVGGDERAHLAQLGETLAARVVGQPTAIHAITGTIQRARLGLADPRRPRGSFLLLGPSGVGKTETAKAISEALYGSEQAMVRLDMSEYGEAHTAVRLTGSPPGYVGYEAGGQLTNPILAKPYSLVLLDELEKAHARLHDVFLQVLDDGRLTDATGQLVDFSQTVVLATSNVATQAIIDQSAAGGDLHDPQFFDHTVLPQLLQQFRPEFINRFDAVVIYEPLSDATLLLIAKLGLAQLEQRLTDRSIRFAIPEDRLRTWLIPLRNPLLGARPVRRMLRDRIETPLARHLLETPATDGFTVTGEESWLK